MLQTTTTPIDTDGDGDATVYLGSNIRGLLLELRYYPGTLATGASLTVTGETSGKAILTKSSAGTSNVSFCPRALPSAVAYGSDGSSSSELIPMMNERIKVVVASGGATKSGSIQAIWITPPQY